MSTEHYLMLKITQSSTNNNDIVAYSTSAEVFTSDIGSVDCKSLKFFNLPIARSKRIFCFDKDLDTSTSFWDNCNLPLVKAGIAREAPCSARSSPMLKPLSAKIKSPGKT